MIQFDLHDDKVQVDAASLLVQEFQDIWYWDKTKTKEKATRLLTFVYFFCDVDSPFANAPKSDKEGLCWKQARMPESISKEEQDMLNAACDRYLSCNETAEKRFLLAWDDKLDQLRQLVIDTNPKIKEITTKNGEIKFNTNTAILTKIMTELDKLQDAKEKLEARIAKKNVGAVVKGQKTPSLLEQNKIG